MLYTDTTDKKTQTGRKNLKTYHDDLIQEEQY